MSIRASWRLLAAVLVCCCARDVAAQRATTGQPPPRQREIVTAPTTPASGDLVKLSPDLRAAVVAGATLVGVTEKGRGVLQAGGAVTIATMTDRIAAAGGALALTSSRVIATDAVLVTYSGPAPGSISFAGARIVPGSQTPHTVVIRVAAGLTPAAIRTLAALSWATRIEPFLPTETTGDWSGTLHMGMMAVGGETTGIVIQTTTGRIELQPATDAVRRQMEALDGQAVTVHGTLSTKAGVEIAERRIIQVTSVVRK